MKFNVDELEPAFRELLAELGQMLDEAEVPWMLVGGLAIGAWTEARATKDTDFALELPSDPSLLESHLSELGFSFQAGELAALRKGGVVRITKPGTPTLITDLLCAGTEFEREALSRRRRLDVLRVPMWIASPDDLLIYKLVAGRPHDMADIDRSSASVAPPKTRPTCGAGPAHGTWRRGSTRRWRRPIAELAQNCVVARFPG